MIRRTVSNRFAAWCGAALLTSHCCSSVAQQVGPAKAYAYSGGSFSVTLAFKAFVSFESDGSSGGDVGNPGWLVVSNLTTGQSTSFAYLQSLKLPETPGSDASSGDGTISGTLTIDPDVLGPGALAVSVQGVTVSRPFHPSQSSANVYGDYVVTTLVPRNVQIALPPYGSNNLSTSPPGTSVQSGGSGSKTSSNIHAVIISGLSDPAKVIVSPNVTLTGGVIALGKNPTSAATPSTWSQGLRIVPDYALLTGEKIPPVTPNILDVRIVRQEVTADFPSPSAQPSN